MRVAKETVYLDTDYNYTADDVRSWLDCDDTGKAIPAEGTSEWYDAISDMRQQDIDDFYDNAAYAKVDEVVMCVHYSTRYSGFESDFDAYAAGSLHDVGSLVGKFNADGFRVVGSPDGLRIHAYHHDGSYTAEVRKLTKKGRAYAERHGGLSELGHDELAKLATGKGYSSPIRDYLF